MIYVSRNPSHFPRGVNIFTLNYSLGNLTRSTKYKKAEKIRFSLTKT